MISIIKPSVKIIDALSSENVLRKLNRSARKCYQSEPKNTPDENLVRSIIKSGHTSVLEHVSFTFDIITDRGVLAELTRHRMAGYSVESTRYCKYNNKDMVFIEPVTIKQNDALYDIWRNTCLTSEMAYNELMAKGAKAQEARQVLNNSLKVEIRMTVNIRSLRNVFTLRCHHDAHPHIKQIFIPLLLRLRQDYPVIFDGIEYDEEFCEKYLMNEDGSINIDVSYETEFDPKVTRLEIMEG